MLLDRVVCVSDCAGISVANNSKKERKKFEEKGMATDYGGRPSEQRPRQQPLVSISMDGRRPSNCRENPRRRSAAAAAAATIGASRSWWLLVATVLICVAGTALAHAQFQVRFHSFPTFHWPVYTLPPSLCHPLCSREHDVTLTFC